jgi:superfamily II DNA or RNA helicase
VRALPDPDNVMLRGEQVVFSFPYRADIVDVVRGIPGRRFDWDAREWSAPATDDVALHVRGVLERFPELRVALEVEAWLEPFGDAWVGRVGTAKVGHTGAFRLEKIVGELPEELAAVAEVRPDLTWLPFTPEVAQQLLSMPGARLDGSALRCAVRLADGRPAPPGLLTIVHDSYGQERFGLQVTWDPDVLTAFLQLPEADGASRAVPLDPFLADTLDAFLRDYGVEVAAEARAALEIVREEAAAAADAVARSRATEADPIPGLPERLGGELAPFQHAGVRYVLDARRCFLADEQGLGKTVQALAALEAADAFPAVVVCPASLKLNWERESARWLPERSVHVVHGTAPVFPKADITILNYEVVHAHTQRLTLSRPKALVLDESHYVKNPRARRTKATRRLSDAIGRNAIKLALTGTPVLNRPEELVSQLRIIGRLEELGSGASLSRKFKGMGAEQRLHWHLRRRCFARRLKSEVLPQLPAKRRVIVPVELSNEPEYRQAEKDVIAWLREQPLDLSELDAKIAAALRAERLAQLTTLKRLAARGKLAAARTWIADFLTSGERLVVFAQHREVLEALLETFPDALHLLGRDSVTARDAAVAAFQEEDGAQLIICSMRVAAQGITLTRASNVCFLELDWTPAMQEQAEDRVHRIGQHDAVVAWHLLAANTIDETMATVIERKRGLIGAVTDGRADEGAALVDSVVRELRETEPARRLKKVAG